MDLKRKLKKFVSDIKEHTGKTPEEEIAPVDFPISSPAITKFKEHINDPTDPQAEQAIIESIEESFFNDDTFDPALYLLEKLPGTLEPEEIVEDLQKLKRQHVAVSRKVSELVLENHPAYETELQRVMELQDSLQMAAVICTNSRFELDFARKKFTTASLGLLANNRKRQQLNSVLNTLRTIRTLQRTDIRLREMVEEEDYPGAIQLCLECQKAASTFRHYKCISELSSKLQDTLEMIEEALDVALSRTCNSFDENHYEKVQTAYKLLGKTQTAMDQLHMHFTSAIHNKAFTIVLGYVELCSGTGDTNFQKRQYSDLCKNISVDMFTPCLIDLCKGLWDGMRSYRKTMLWHDAHDKDTAASADESSGVSASDVEKSINRRYVRQKLQHGCTRVWGDVQQKVKVYLLSTDLSGFKYDEFIQVLDVIGRLIQIGEEFCGSQSEGLQDSIRKQSLNYFRTYHRLRMDELRMFLENEGWELCPVKSSFSILQLQEFKFLRNLTKNDLNNSKQSFDSNGSPKSEKYFEKYSVVGNPFDPQTEEDEQEDVLETNGYGDGSFLVRTPSQDSSDSDDDVPDELKRDFIDEGETPPAKRFISKTRKSSSSRIAPIITNTTLNVCRLFGKYMQMMSVLKPIAFDVVLRMSQLFDYYLHTVYSFFAVDEELHHLNERFLSSKLRTTLKRISDNLIMHTEAMQDVAEGGSTEESDLDKVAHPHISPIVRLDAADNLNGLAERVVATESLIFLAEQFEFLQSHLDAMMPSTKKAFLQQFYSQTVCMAPELRQPVYRNVAARSMNHEALLHSMGNVRWDIKELMSQHSPYVDDVLKEFEKFRVRMTEVSRRVPIPHPANCVLWEHCILMASGSFVEGYASARKCSNEGRALMQLDFQQFLIKLDTITDLRPIPGREFVETYIKAYYLPEAQLEVWIRDHKEYSARQLIALVNCIPHISKKARQKLNSLIEDIEKTRR